MESISKLEKIILSIIALMALGSEIAPKCISGASSDLMIWSHVSRCQLWLRKQGGWDKRVEGKFFFSRFQNLTHNERCE